MIHQHFKAFFFRLGFVLAQPHETQNKLDPLRNLEWKSVYSETVDERVVESGIMEGGDVMRWLYRSEEMPDMLLGDLCPGGTRWQ